MSNTLARPPYARADAADFPSVNRELVRVAAQQQGMFVPTVLVSARSPYTVRSTDWLILCDCTAGPITLTFPLAARVDGLYVTVVKTDASANAVTLSGTFSGSVNPTLGVQHAMRIIQAGNGVYEMTPKLADLSGGTIVGDIAITGKLTVSDIVSKANGTQSCANATPTTLVTVTPNIEAIYRVSAKVTGTTNAHVVCCDCATSNTGVDAPALIGTVAGGLLTLSVTAAGAIQATQTFGSTQTVQWAILRVD